MLSLLVKNYPKPVSIVNNVKKGGKRNNNNNFFVKQYVKTLKNNWDSPCESILFCVSMVYRVLKIMHLNYCQKSTYIIIQLIPLWNIVIIGQLFLRNKSLHFILFVSRPKLSQSLSILLFNAWNLFKSTFFPTS